MYCSRRAQVDGTAGQVRKRERFMFCANKGQKKNHQSGWAALKWRKQLLIQWGNGQVRWAGNSNQKAICWPWTVGPRGTEQILSSRRPQRGASTSRASKQCQDEALKLHEPHVRSCPASLLPNVKSSGNTVFSYLRTWQTHSTGPLCEGRMWRGSSSNVSAHYPSPSPEAAGPPLLAADGGSCQACTWGSCWLGDTAIGPQELTAQVRSVQGSLWSWKAAHQAIGWEQRGRRKQEQNGQGTDNDLVLMGSTPQWKEGPAWVGFCPREPAAARSYQY